jgi:hypothetical protein
VFAVITVCSKGILVALITAESPPSPENELKGMQKYLADPNPEESGLQAVQARIHLLTGPQRYFPAHMEKVLIERCEERVLRSLGTFC